VTGVQDLLQLKRVVTGFLLITVLLHSSAPAAVREFVLFAHVEGVDRATKTVIVKHGKIAGYTEKVPATYELADESLGAMQTLNSSVLIPSARAMVAAKHSVSLWTNP
jgi:hypothetical protein